MSPVSKLPESTRSRALARLKPSSVHGALLPVSPLGGSALANGASRPSTSAASTSPPISPPRRAAASTSAPDLGVTALPADRLGPGQPDLAADLGLGLAAALLLGLGLQRRHRAWPPVLVERDEHQVRGGGVGAPPAHDVLGLDPHPDLHGGAAHVVHAGVHEHHVADVDRVQEAHLV